jgi:hypothetical protein
MDLSLKQYEGYFVHCEYNLNVPKDTPITGKIEGKIKNGVVSFQFKSLFQVSLKRGTQSLIGQFTRKSATFKLTVHKKGFFSTTTVPLGIASLPLNCLLCNCDCGGKLNLFNDL